LGQGSNRRTSDVEGDIAGDPKISVPAGGARDSERESAGAVPVESAGLCGQRLPRERLINGDARQARSIVEFELLEVYRPRLRPINARRQSHYDIDVCPILGHCHGAKRRGATAAATVVRRKIEYDGMTGGWKCRCCSNQCNCT